MNKKFILIGSVVIAALIAVFMLWRSAHPKAPKYVVAKKVPAAAVQAVKKAAPKEKSKAAPAPVSKKFQHPKVAIVMDDFGNNTNDLETFFAISKPITLSILPNLRYSKEIASEAHSKGYEVILHLPLEPHRKDVKEESDTIKSGMSEKEIEAKLEKEILSLPYIDGVSNHMGSKSTEDSELMKVIFRYLKSKGLYFFDSLTSEKSVCRDAAASAGIKYARRNIFLDNSGDVASIEKELVNLKRIAFMKGRVIAVCHDRKNTISVLSKNMPLMAKEGINFIFLSELVK